MRKNLLGQSEQFQFTDEVKPAQLSFRQAIKLADVDKFDAGLGGVGQDEDPRIKEFDKYQLYLARNKGHMD